MVYKKLVVAGIIFILFVSNILMTGCSKPKKDASEIKEEMTGYLQNRYQMEFMVEKPTFTGNEGLGSLWSADAHPTTNQELDFRVVQDKNSYDDNYLNQLWTSQGKPQVEALLKKNYGEDLDLYLNFEFYYYSDQLEANFNELKKLNYSDLINSHGPYLFCIVDCDVFLGENEFDKQVQAVATAKFCNDYFDRYNIGSRDIFVQYVDKKHKEEYLKMERAGFESSDVFEHLHDENILINILRIHDDELINVTPEDIIQQFEY